MQYFASTFLPMPLQIFQFRPFPLKLELLQLLLNSSSYFSLSLFKSIRHNYANLILLKYCFSYLSHAKNYFSESPLLPGKSQNSLVRYWRFSPVGPKLISPYLLLSHNYEPSKDWFLSSFKIVQTDVTDNYM